MTTRPLIALSLYLVLLVSTGCGVFKSSTIQASSESSSKSSSSSFKSSSGSDSDSEDSAFHRDIRDATAAYVRTGGDLATFYRTVGSIAEQHGVTDWEGEPATYTAMGLGLAKAEVPPADAEALGLQIAGADATHLEWVLAAYAAER